MQNRLFLLMLSPVISKDQEQGSDNQNCNERKTKKNICTDTFQSMKLLRKCWLMKLNWQTKALKRQHMHFNGVYLILLSQEQGPLFYLENSW